MDKFVLSSKNWSCKGCQKEKHFVQEHTPQVDGLALGDLLLTDHRVCQRHSVLNPCNPNVPMKKQINFLLA